MSTWAAIKAAKRRTVQKTLVMSGKTERTCLDPVFEQAVTDFHEYRSAVETIRKNVKESLTATKSFTARNASLGCQLAAFFASDGNQGSSLREPSSLFSKSLTQGHDVVQRSAAKILYDEVVVKLKAMLENDFPVIQKKIYDHDELETDLESYQRRVKDMQEAGKAGNDPKMIKFSTKLGRCREKYDAVHSETLSELKDFVDTRHATLHKTFLTITACLAELQSQLSRGLESVLSQADHGDVPSIRYQISALVDAGGPQLTDAEQAELEGRGNGFSKALRRLSVARPSKDSKGSATDGGDEAAQIQSAAAPAPPPPKAAEVDLGPMPGGSEDLGPPTPSWDDTPSAPPPGMGSAESLEDEDNVGVATASFDYTGVDENDLTFKKGDTIIITEKIDEGWWRGYLKGTDAEPGLFPSNYVTVQE